MTLKELQEKVNTLVEQAELGEEDPILDAEIYMATGIVQDTRGKVSDIYYEDGEIIVWYCVIY